LKNTKHKRIIFLGVLLILYESSTTESKVSNSYKADWFC